MITGVILGSIAGSIGGSVFSPNDEDRSKNAYMFGALGGALGTGTGYLLYKDPEVKKREQDRLLIEDAKKNLPIFEFSEELKGIKPEVTFTPRQPPNSGQFLT